MSRLILEISNNVAESLQLPPTERRSRLQRELAVRSYQIDVIWLFWATCWRSHSNCCAACPS